MNAVSDKSEYDRLRMNLSLPIDMSREQFDALSPKEKEDLRASDDTDELLNALGETLCPWVVKYRAAGPDALTSIIGTWIEAWADDWYALEAIARANDV
jgi:hypothetical protein